MICSRCTYDERIPFITFDTNGVCNYCHQYDNMMFEYEFNGKAKMERIVEQMKKDGKGRDYDVVVGVSGGCDSSYMLHLTKEWGLRPLAAHCDNGWNEPIGEQNLKQITDKMGVDLFNLKVDDAVGADLMRSFMLASVPDIDAASDIALAVTHYRAAVKHNVKYIFCGHNFKTEGISPMGWFYFDAQYIKTVHDLYGRGSIKSFPNLDFFKWMNWTLVKGIKKIRPLYYINYKKDDAKKILNEKYGWEWYGGHHMENRTAYFTDNYWLPVKFGIDLRKSECAALVRNGQMTRKEALAELGNAPVFDMKIIDEVKEKLGFTTVEFKQIMKAPNKSYRDYKTNKQLFERLAPMFKMMAKAQLVPITFYEKFCRRY